jgi:hypothetical protein
VEENVIAEHTEDGAFGDEAVDCAERPQQFRMIMNRSFHVGRRNGDAYACAGAQDKRWSEECLKLADGGVVDVEGELAGFCGGMAGASAKGFAGVSMKEEPENLP